MVEAAETRAEIDSSARAAPREKWVKAAVLVLVAGLFLLGMAAIAGSLVPFSSLQVKIRNLSATGKINFFTPQFYLGMQTRLRIIGAILMLAAVAMFFLRKRMSQLAINVLTDGRELWRDTRFGLKSLPGNELVVLGCLILFAAALRIPHLFEPMRYDESFTFLQYASRPFYAALSFYDAPNNHLLHTLLVRVAYLIFGDHPWALRLPTFFAGICLVPATYLAARALYGAGGALLASGLVASSSILIEYATNARGYSILGLIFLMLIPLSLYSVRHKNRAGWLCVAVLAALGFYTVPIMLYPFCGILVWLLLSEGIGRSRVITLVVTAGLVVLFTAVLYLPVFAVTGPKAVVANPFIIRIPYHELVHDLPLSFVSTWKEWNRDLPLLVVLALVAGFVLALIRHRKCGALRLPLAFALVLGVAPLLFIQRVIPPERVWLFALPLYLLTAAAGAMTVLKPALERVRLPHSAIALAVVITLTLGIRVQRSNSIHSLNYGRGMDSMAAFLSAELKPGDSVIPSTNLSEESLRYYFHHRGVSPDYFNAPNPHRILIIVNDVTGDTLPAVLARANIPDDRPAKLLARYDSASLYEIAPGE